MEGSKYNFSVIIDLQPGPAVLSSSVDRYNVAPGVLQMPRVFYFLFIVTVCVLAVPVRGQVAAATAAATATCSFDDDHEMVVNYQPVSFNLKKATFSHEVAYGKVWAPGQKPLTLLINSSVEIGGKVLPMGGYTMFIIPNPKQWTLVVSKSTDTSGKYDEQQDLVRVSMESGELPTPQSQLSVSFAHIAPDQCSIRVDLDKTGNFATFQKR
jgi:hypothetical protein